jgi:hypothetical protein
MRARLKQLRSELELQAEDAVKHQLNQPKAPWQHRSVRPTHSVAANPTRKDAAAKAGASPHPQPMAHRSKPVAIKGRSKAIVKKAQQVEAPDPPFNFWELPAEAPVRESPPTTISAKDLETFCQILKAGAQASSEGPREDLFATIGLDFGTSTTKVIVRFPYEPGAPSIAIPAPTHCRSMQHPYLWQTVLWLNDAGEFTAWPTRSGILLHALKQGVVGLLADSVVAPAAGLNVTRTEAATAFLAFVIKFARGWLAKNRPQILRNRRPVWFASVGLPVATFDSGPPVTTYRRAAAAATLLASLDGPITTEMVRLILTDPNVSAAAKSSNDAEQLGVAVIPETAAEAAGFAKSTNRAPGLYLMVDVGALTLDACTFGLGQHDSSSDLYSLLNAQVHPLGVESYFWFSADGKSQADFVEQCNRCLWEVVWGTKRTKDPRAECWQPGHDLPVFLVGGGANNPLHRDIVQELDPWLRTHSQNNGIRLVDLPLPANLELPEKISDFGRLGVAWGLSYPPNEIGKILPPSAIKDKLPLPISDWSGRFIGKEYV